MRSPTSTLEPFRANELFRVRRNRTILALAGSPLFLGVPALIIAAIAIDPVYVMYLFHSAALGILGLTIAWRRNWHPEVKPVAVRADANGVAVGEEHVPRAHIKQGFVMPGVPPQVQLRRRGLRTPVEIQVGSMGEARALLRALGLDASQTVATFRGISKLLAKRRYLMSVGLFFGGFVFGMTNVFRFLSPAFSAVGVAMFAASALTFAVLMIAPMRITVGADGIATRWLWQKRFYGFGEISMVTRFERGFGRSRVVGLELLLRSGEEVFLPMSQRSWDDGDAGILDERVREAMEAFRRGDAAADAALLRRGDRAVGEWVSALRSIGAGANADLRTAPVPRERLFRIVEDPSSPPADRAAAAVALGSELDADARARLQAAAEATAAPKLRIAIEKAASGSEAAEVEAALAEIEAEAQEKARAS
jgi:hypothetical protein